MFPYPAGIRYHSEFIDDNLVIGLNTDQEPGTANNQNYKTFVDGMVLVEKDTQYPNGGIFSTTNRANYQVMPTFGGKAYIIRAMRSGVRNIKFTTKNGNPLTSRMAIWIDWGNGNCGYVYMPKGATSATYNTTYRRDEYHLYNAMVLYDKTKLNIDASELTGDNNKVAVAEYDLCAGGVG